VLVACSFAQPTCSGGTVASYRMAETTMTLRDGTTPTASNLSGDLIANPTWRGAMSLAFTASDTGSGVYRLIVNVDGQDALGVVVDANDGRCADADTTNSDPHEFLWPAPCKASVGPQLSVDMGSLPLGAQSRWSSRTPPATARRSTARWPRRSSRRRPIAAPPTERRPATPPASPGAGTAR
jgi:hypothetical protein